MPAQVEGGVPRSLHRALALAPTALCAGVVVLVLGWAGGPLSDPDVWWHVATGRLIVDDVAVPSTDPWTFTAPEDSWVPTAWLSDVLFGLVADVGGDDGLRALRVAMATAAIAATWLLARRNASSSRSALLATALVVLALAPFLRERPQVLSFLLVAWLAAAVQDVLAGKLPRHVVWVPLCWVWAQIHGMWVLLPAAALGAGVLAWVDDRSRVPLAARCTSVAVLSWVAVLATPVGPELAWWPLVVRDVAGPISEWQATVPTRLVGAPLALIVATLLVRWGRSESRVPPSRILYVLAVALFGLLAFRNVAPAALLLLPELVRPLDGRPAVVDIPRVTRLGMAAAGAGLALAAVNLALAAPISDNQPVRLVRELASSDQEVRLLNHYDVGGLVTGTASPPVRAAIDGRTDLWSAEFVSGYIDALAGDEDWRPLVDELRPDAALLPKSSVVARGLVEERGWRVVSTEGGWALLRPTG